MVDRWVRRACQELCQIIIPGIAALLLMDMNVNLFRGEFTMEDMANINTVILYYVDKLDLTGQQQVPYGLVFIFFVYFLGYFLHSSSKYFIGPQKFRGFLSVKGVEDIPHIPLPPSAENFLNAKPGDLQALTGEEVCQTLIETAGIPSRLATLENRSAMYRSFGYLFTLMMLLDLGLFAVAFDFDDVILKISVLIINVVFAFLFFKGQEESTQEWKEQLSAETLIAVNRMNLNQ